MNKWLLVFGGKFEFSGHSGKASVASESRAFLLSTCFSAARGFRFKKWRTAVQIRFWFMSHQAFYYKYHIK